MYFIQLFNINVVSRQWWPVDSLAGLLHLLDETDKVVVLKEVIFQWKGNKEVNKEISDTINAMQRM